MIDNIINSKFFAGLTATVASVSVIASGTTANAAALIGEFQFSGLGVAELTQDSLNFNSVMSQDPNTALLFLSPSTATGSFNQFAGDTTTIHGPVEFNPFSAPVPFIDFGGGNIFNLQDAEIGEVIQSGENASVDIILDGTFFSADGYESDGAGNLTLSFNDTSASTIEQKLEAGETLTAQFSGAIFSNTASTPEPTALFGLGIVGAGLVATRRRKKKSEAKIW